MHPIAGFIMKPSKLVSVIIPTYNRAHTICRAIDSVIRQTHSFTEVIVVDDGSTDETPAVLRRYGDRIRVVVQQNCGPSIARNRGIALATGHVVAFLDSDDYWLPTKLERQLELMDKEESVVCCLCNCAVLYKDGSTTSTFQIARSVPACKSGLWLNPAEVLLTRFLLFSQAVAIRRDVLERIGYFDETLRFGEDYELPLRLALEGPWAIIRDELVVYHAAGQGSWSETAIREQVRLRQDLLRMREQILARIETDAMHRGLISLARREVRRARRELVAARLIGKRAAIAVALGRIFRFLERVNLAVFRRTPFYPKLIIRPLN